MTRTSSLTSFSRNVLSVQSQRLLLWWRHAISCVSSCKISSGGGTDAPHEMQQLLLATSTPRSLSHDSASHLVSSLISWSQETGFFSAHVLTCSLNVKGHILHPRTRTQGMILSPFSSCVTHEDVGDGDVRGHGSRLMFSSVSRVVDPQGKREVGLLFPTRYLDLCLGV